jgi:hypothetical protein
MASADDAARPANTLMDMRRAFAACVSQTPLATGSRVTIAFMMKRDGSIFGRPRITFARLEGDSDAKARFVDDARRAVDACLPLRVTPALGNAIAGRIFTITLDASGRRRAPESAPASTRRNETGTVRRFTYFPSGDVCCIAT